MRITLVTVTYGSRWQFLARTLEAARAEGVDSCIVVDNGSSEPIATLVQERFAGWAETVTLPRNAGSAPAFKLAMETALARGAEYIFVLDDDNLVAPGCIARLKAVMASQEAHAEGRPLALLAYREEHLRDAVDRAIRGRPARPPSAFRGFHVLDVGRKIAARLRPPAPVKPGEGDAIVPLPFGVYGGLFFHRRLLERIGLPEPRFVLYADDSEFTARIPRAGGRLLAVRDAEVIDDDHSWHVGGKSSFATLLLTPEAADLRAFYTFRNGVYWDVYCSDAGPLVWVNMTTYMALLGAAAVAWGRGRRFALLARAAWNGVRRRLDEDPEFPLGGSAHARPSTGTPDAVRRS